jgi:hypothetical protein
MTLKDAEKIVQEYGSVLASVGPNDGPAFYETQLPCSTTEIIQAMKLWLAYDIQNRSLTQEFLDEIGTAASRLPYFIDETKARRLNTIWSNSSVAKCADLSTQDFIERINAAREVTEWTTTAMMAGVSLRGELTDFVARQTH